MSVCVCPSLFLSVYEPIIIPLVLHLPYAWLPSNLLCTVCQGDTPHTHKHTHLLKVCIASSFFWLHHPRPLLPFSFTSHVSSLFSLSFSTLLVSVQAYSLAFLPSPLYLPPSPFLTGKKKNILSPSGKKSGCIRVMRKFKSLKEDCTVACTKLIFSQCERVCSCVRVYVCGFYSSTHAFTYSLLRNVCLYLPSCQCVFRSSPSCFIFYFLFHFLSVSLLKVKSQL